MGLQRGLRPKAEEAVESELSAVLHDQGFGLWGDALFPPVDIRFGHLPTIIVTSRRDKIARVERRLLRPELGVHRARAGWKTSYFEKHDLSAIVGNSGGTVDVSDAGDRHRLAPLGPAHGGARVVARVLVLPAVRAGILDFGGDGDAQRDSSGHCRVGSWETRPLYAWAATSTENARRYLPQEDRDPSVHPDDARDPAARGRASRRGKGTRRRRST